MIRNPLNHPYEFVDVALDLCFRLAEIHMKSRTKIFARLEADEEPLPFNVEKLQNVSPEACCLVFVWFFSCLSTQQKCQVGGSLRKNAKNQQSQAGCCQKFFCVRKKSNTKNPRQQCP